MFVALSNKIEPAQKSRFRIIPAGTFSASDGRQGRRQWHLSEQAAQGIIAAFAARTSDVVIDYEHAMLKSAETGAQAPAAGWFKSLAWCADGLYVTDARWTEKARQMIDQGEYRYISPVFNFSPDGSVTALVNVALVNYPGLDGLTDLAQLSGSLSGGYNPEVAKINWLIGVGDCPEKLGRQAALSGNGPTPRTIDQQSAQHFKNTFGFDPNDCRR